MMNDSNVGAVSVRQYYVLEVQATSYEYNVMYSATHPTRLIPIKITIPYF